MDIKTSSLNNTSKVKYSCFRNNLQLTGEYLTRGLETFSTLKWKSLTNGRVYSSPVIAGELLYIGSEDGCLYALEKGSGKVIWKFETNGPVHSTAAVGDGIVYFTSHDGNLYAVDAGTGILYWYFKTGGEKILDPWDYFLSSPTVYNGVVYFGSGDHHIYAVDARSGEKIWGFKTGGIVHASPAIQNETLYIGSYDGFFYALELQSGKIKWAFRTVGNTWFPNGEIQGSACVINGTVYFGSRDYNLYAVNAETGRGKWNIKMPSWVISSPAYRDGVIYCGTSDLSKVIAVDANTGKLKWEHIVHLNTFSSPAVVNDTLYIGNMNGKLYAFDLESGEQKWFYQTEDSISLSKLILNLEGKLGNAVLDIMKNAQTIEEYEEAYHLIMSLGSIISSPLVNNGIVYFGSTDGYVYAIG